MPATVLDVIDNFFTRDPAADVRRIPGRQLYELGRESRRLASASATPAATSGSIYLGGWPSANFWAVSGDLIMSTLLYADSVVVKDPLTDWFSESQYHVPHVMSTRPGYIDPESRRPSVAQTRAFLSVVIPSLRALRPLIDTGALILTPSHDFLMASSHSVETLADRLMADLVPDSRAYAERFAPTEIAIADNVRGMFFGVGGEQDQSVRRSLRHGMRYFAREYSLSGHIGATYTAPFRHESYLCQYGLNSLASPSDRVSSALMRTGLPILTGLTPAIVAKIRADDSYCEFREQLHNLYSALPVGASDDEIARYMADQERALLAAPLERAERELSGGLLGQLGASLSSGRFRIAAGFAVDLAAGTAGLATALGALKAVGEQVVTKRQTAGPQRIWNTLVKHNRRAEEEMSGVYLELGTNPSDPYWGISDTPSMSVSVTPGAVLTDFIPRPADTDQPTRSEYRAGAYAPCDCGSGLGFRYCCRGLKADF